MTDEEITGGGSATEEATTVGNVFISNYPAYSFWTPDEVDEAESALHHGPSRLG